MYDEDMPATHNNVRFFISEIKVYKKYCETLEDSLREAIREKKDKVIIEGLNEMLAKNREIIQRYTDKLEYALNYIKFFGEERSPTPDSKIDIENSCIGYVNGKAIYRTCMLELFYEETERRFATYGLPCDDLDSLIPFTSLPKSEQGQILSILSANPKLYDWITKYKHVRKIREEKQKR